MTACQQARVTECTAPATETHITGCTRAEHINRYRWCPEHGADMQQATETGHVNCWQCYAAAIGFSRVRLLKIEPVGVSESRTSA